MAFKKWVIAEGDKDRASEISEKFNIDPFISFLLVSRGFDDDLSVSDFLSSSKTFFDPFGLKDMDRAVDRIEEAFANEEKITIYGDYDCDGITSTALLVDFFRENGANVDFYIPSRENEGYGLNLGAIDKIKASGTNLIVTVDNGISAIEEAEYIKSLSMDLVITDHHQLGDELPNAVAVVNPHRKDNDIPFEDICGVGVAFKLATAIYGDATEILERYADIIAIGTVGDVMPLVNENRTYVKEGLNQINFAPRAGIKALKRIALADKSEIKSGDLAFAVCPRLNATGRIENAKIGVRLLLTEDEKEAGEIVEQINVDNVKRKEIEDGILEDVERQIASNKALIKDSVIVIDGKGYHKGVVGIVASRILEKYGKPAIIIGIDDEGNARGSARSIEGFNIFDAISSCSDLLIQFGGHPLAAGLSLKEENIALFRQKINEYARENYPFMPPRELKIDCKLSPLYVSLDLAEHLADLEPYGEGNPTTVFALMGMKINSVQVLKGGNHIRFECEKKGAKVRIVKFRTTPETFPYKVGDIVDVAVKIKKNLFNGNCYVSVQAVDMRYHGFNEEKYLFEKERYERFLACKYTGPTVYPDRKMVAYIYKFLKSHDGWPGDVDSLYFALQGEKVSVTYGQMMFALNMFEESGLITVSGERVNILPVENKVDLSQTASMKFLKERLRFE